MDPTQQEVQDTFQELYNNLTDAFWAASTIESKDFIRGCADVIYDILGQLTIDDIRSRSADFQNLKKSVQSVTAKLQQLQSEITGIIHNINVASSVADGIRKALDVASKFFA